MRKEQTAKQSAFLELDASVRKIDAKDAKGDAKLPRRTPHARQGGSTRRYGHPRSRHGNSIADLRSFPSQLSQGGNKSSSGGTQGRNEVQAHFKPPRSM